MQNDPIVHDFDAGLTQAERAVIVRAREFGEQVVAPNAALWERERRVPLEALREACKLGLAAIELPVASGGAGLRFSAKMRVVEELSRFDFAFAFSLVNHHNAIVRVARGSPPLASRLVPRMLSGELIGCSAFTEPGHGSDLANLTTQARKVDGGWVLTGAKAWTTNAAVAGVFVTLAQTQPGSGGKGLATFVVEADRAGFSREPAYAIEGCHAIGLGGFRLQDYLASDEAMIVPLGESFRASIEGINGARCYVAAMCAGMLNSAIECATRRASTRQAFGRPVIEFQGPRWSLVDADTDLAALRLLAYRAAKAIDSGQAPAIDAARAKKFAGQRTLPHIAACVQAMGAEGLRAEYPLMRHMAACKAAAFADGSTEMMNERLGKLVLSPPGSE